MEGYPAMLLSHFLADMTFSLKTCFCTMPLKLFQVLLLVNTWSYRKLSFTNSSSPVNGWLQSCSATQLQDNGANIGAKVKVYFAINPSPLPPIKCLMSIDITWQEGGFVCFFFKWRRPALMHLPRATHPCTASTLNSVMQLLLYPWIGA